MGYTHIDKPVGKEGVFVGAKGAEVQVASSTGALYQSGTAITATAAELNKLSGVTKTTTQINQGTDSYEAVAGSTNSAAGSALVGYGISAISSTNGAKYYDLAAPVAGQCKTLICTAGSSTNTVTVNAGSGITFDGTNYLATFNAADDVLDLVGISDTRWFIKTNGGSVALATT